MTFNWIDKIPIAPLAVITFLMALAPFGSQPHLVEKLGMLFQWQLSRPIDIFDLFMHGTPAVLLLVRVVRMLGKKRSN